MISYNISKGNVLRLSECDVTKPIVLSNLRGTYDEPIVVRCKSLISINTFGKDPAKASNQIALDRQQNGFYPHVGQISDQAAVTLFNCQFVVLQNLSFADSWPTALYLNDCQNIAVMDCDFHGSTTAIAANGVDTRDIWVEGCRWQQTAKNALWEEIEWREVHGSFENAPVGGVLLDTDKRHLDGDFFRAWNIAGNVTIRDNDIEDCFNGVHFFNSVDDIEMPKDRSMARFNNGRRSAFNVLIENNRFVRVRDNCVEPEDHAWNWVVRSNTFEDCYAPYSFELKRAGWFYIYDNHHWFENQAKIGGRIGGSGFKCSGDQANEGDIYIFNNSWLFNHGERLFRRGALGRMKHFNNAIKVKKGTLRRLFGNGWQTQSNATEDDAVVKEEKKRFTRRWRHFKIEMNGDWISDGGDWREYRFFGYRLGLLTQNTDPGYTAATPKSKKKTSNGKWLQPSRAMKKAGAAWKMRLPAFFEAGKGSGGFQHRYEIEVEEKWGVGAGMSRQRQNFFRDALDFTPKVPMNLPRRKKRTKSSEENIV